MRSPLLLIAFNRPETTESVMRAIRQARPPRLYVAADAPREDHPQEAELCSRVRDIATTVDWPCEVHTLFQSSNLGPRRSISTAISWFFSHEAEGLILEDDVIPVASYFPFVDEMLERWRDSPQVGAITATNGIADKLVPSPSEDYFFTRSNHVWGIATWRRVWNAYDVEMRDFEDWDARGALLECLDSRRCLADYWRKQFRKATEGRVDTWDYQWQFMLWKRGLLTVMPRNNMMENIGFGACATNTTKVPAYIKRNPPHDLPLPFAHPAEVRRNQEADELIDRYVSRMTHVRCAKFAMKRMLGMTP
jgi:hypothetical protein